MPRARTTPAIEDEGVTKKPRTTRVRAVSSGEDTPLRAPRKRAPKRVVEDVSEPEPTRKAPTLIREQRRAVGASTRNFIIILVVCLSIMSIGFGIGFSDKGQINVVAIVNERNEKINRGEVRTATGEAITQTIPIQGSDNRPNGGLTPADPAATVPPPSVDVPTDPAATASSTEGTAATTTEATPPVESASTTPADAE